MSRRRSLSDEEHALWDGVARSITPLRPVKPGPKAKAKLERQLKPAAAPKTMPPPQRAAVPRETKSAKPALPSPLDRRQKRRVARGRDEIEARIDLHGMTQSQAHAALFHFLHGAQADGKRLALVVTGKGTRARDGASERGVLRRQVPLWLSLPEFHRLVVGFDEAHISHGGEGALYVRLRRAR